MPSFPFIAHEWLSNTFTAVFYEHFGYIGLCVITVLIFYFTVFVSLKLSSKGTSKLGIWVITALVLLITTLQQFFGVRTQVISWLIYAAFLHVVINEDRWKRWRLLVPLGFVLWVNLHGSFAAGIFTLIFFTLVRIFKTKKLSVEELVVIFLCLLATLVNPYGIEIWREVFQTITDASLRWFIQEWMPIFFSGISLLTVALFVFSAFLLFRYRKKYKLELIFLYLFWLVQSILSVRHTPLWAIIAVPIMIDGFGFLYDEVSKKKFGLKRYYQMGKYAAVFFTVLFILDSVITISGKRNLREDVFYPKSAVEFLKSQNISGEVFSSYNWGGYLIWKYPEKKVFIDGRMPSWRWKAAKASESNFARDDYIKLLNGEIPYEEVFSKYNIDAVLFHPFVAKEKPKGILAFLNRLLEITNPLGKMVTFSEEIDKDQNWEKIYEDKVAVIYRRR